jgi:hypothetical protein
MERKGMRRVKRPLKVSEINEKKSSTLNPTVVGFYISHFVTQVLIRELDKQKLLDNYNLLTT